MIFETGVVLPWRVVVWKAVKPLVTFTWSPQHNQLVPLGDALAKQPVPDGAKEPTQRAAHNESDRVALNEAGDLDVCGSKHPITSHR